MNRSPLSILSTQTCWLTLLIALMSFGFLETALRQPAILKILPPQNFDSPYLNEPLARLDLFSREYGKPNCLFLGSSMVFNGINPQIIEASLNAVSPNHYKCYTLGIGSLTVPTAATLVELLIQVYQPEILVYGTSLRDYHSFWFEEKQVAIAENSWVRFHQNHFNLTGWTIEHSYLYRTLLNLPYVMAADYEFHPLGKPSQTIIQGYIPSNELQVEVGQPVSSDNEIDAYTQAAYQNFQELHPQSLAGISKIVSFSTPQTHIVLLEMPIHPTYLDYVENGELIYADLIAFLAEQAIEHQAGFIQTSSAPLSAPTYWNDRHHLNIEGSTIFSEWLGDKLVQLLTPR